MSDFVLNILLGVVFFLLIFTGTIVGQTNDTGPAVVWIIIDQLSITEVSSTRTENIDHILYNSASGLMNVRQVDGYYPGSTYLSLSTGKKSKTNKNMRFTTERKDTYIASNQFDKIIEINKNNYYNPQIGLMGKILRENGYKISVLGNCDNRVEQKRHIANIAMDEYGRIPYGNLSKELLNEVSSPGDYRTDWSKMFEEFKKYRDSSDVIVIETGDMTRIEDFYHDKNYQELEGERNYYKKLALREIDSFIGMIKGELDLARTQLAIIVPTPPLSQLKTGNTLSWALFSGPNFERGLLTSNSTKRNGIFLITDLLPTLLNKLGISNHKYGNDLKVNPTESNWERLLAINNKIKINSNLRPNFIRGFIILQLICIALVIVKFYTKTVILDHIIEYILLGLLLIPLNYLFISNMGLTTWWLYLFTLILLTFLQLYLIQKLNLNYIQKLVFITGILNITIILDLFGLYELMADSLLGYSSQIGARFYGIGNEYMGLFLGASVIFILGLFELFKVKDYPTFLLFSYLFFFSYLTGSAGLGANFGGMITGMIISITIIYYLTPRKFHKQYLLITLLGFIFIIAADYFELFSIKTHIGRSLELLLSGDYSELSSILIRKFKMNLKLLRWTIWTRVILAFIGCLFFLFRYPVGILKKLFSQFQFLSAGYYAIFVGSITTMFVNDSGVVAAATLLFFPMLSLLYLIINITNK